VSPTHPRWSTRSSFSTPPGIFSRCRAVRVRAHSVNHRVRGHPVCPRERARRRHPGRRRSGRPHRQALTAAPRQRGPSVARPSRRPTGHPLRPRLPPPRHTRAIQWGPRRLLRTPRRPSSHCRRMRLFGVSWTPRKSPRGSPLRPPRASSRRCARSARRSLRHGPRGRRRPRPWPWLWRTCAAAPRRSSVGHCGTCRVPPSRSHTKPSLTRLARRSGGRWAARPWTPKSIACAPGRWGRLGGAPAGSGCRPQRSGAESAPRVVGGHPATRNVRRSGAGRSSNPLAPDASWPLPCGDHKGGRHHPWRCSDMQWNTVGTRTQGGQLPSGPRPRAGTWSKRQDRGVGGGGEVQNG